MLPTPAASVFAPSAIPLSCSAKAFSPTLVDEAPVDVAAVPTAVELSPLALAPFPAAIAPAPAAAEFTPHSVELVPAPTTHVAVGPASAAEPMVSAARLAVTSKRLDLDDMILLRKKGEKDARLQLCRREDLARLEKANCWFAVGALFWSAPQVKDRPRSCRSFRASCERDGCTLQRSDPPGD